MPLCLQSSLSLSTNSMSILGYCLLKYWQISFLSYLCKVLRDPTSSVVEWSRWLSWVPSLFNASTKFSGHNTSCFFLDYLRMNKHLVVFSTFLNLNTLKWLNVIKYACKPINQWATDSCSIYNIHDVQPIFEYDRQDRLAFITFKINVKGHRDKRDLTIFLSLV